MRKRKEYYHCNPVAGFLRAFLFSFTLVSMCHTVPRMQTHIETNHHFNTTLAFKFCKIITMYWRKCVNVSLIYLLHQISRAKT